MLSLVAVLAMGLEPVSQSLIASEGRGNYPQVMLAQSQVHGPAASDAPLRSAADLHLELEDLQASMPSIGGPVAMLVTGGVLGVGGFFFAYLGLLLDVFSLGSNAVLLVAGLIGLAAGIGLVVAGVVLLVKAQRQRRAIAKDIDTVRRELRGYEQPGYPVPAQQRPYRDTFSPPPPPPQVEGPHATIMLAAF